MNTLDPFETALLTELREHVAERAVPAPARRRPPWWTGIATAAAVGGAFVAANQLSGAPAAAPAPDDPSSSTTVSPAVRPAAYSVARAPGGDVTVTIRRFSDAAALERSLADAGIDADVHYDGSLSADDSVVPDAPEVLPYVPVDPDDPDAGGALSVPDPSTVVQPGPNGEVRTGDVGPVDPGGCGPLAPASLSREGSTWVLLIPADSPLQDRPIEITTADGNQLGVVYEGDEPGSRCVMMPIAEPGN